VIKINSNKRYATNSPSAAVFKKVCRVTGIVPQEFVMRNDLPCGSTIGPMTSARLGVATLDVGAPTLAMHSIREHTGSADPFLLYQTIKAFVNSDIHKELL
jgi:aspartyl aminopeptidase